MRAIQSIFKLMPPAAQDLCNGGAVKTGLSLSDAHQDGEQHLWGLIFEQIATAPVTVQAVHIFLFILNGEGEHLDANVFSAHGLEDSESIQMRHAHI